MAMTDEERKARRLAYTRQWRKDNRDKLKAQRERYYAKHGKRINAERCAARAAMPKVVKPRQTKAERAALAAKWRDDNRETVNAQARRRYQENPEPKKQKFALWYAANAERLNAEARARSAAARAERIALKESRRRESKRILRASKAVKAPKTPRPVVKPVTSHTAPKTAPEMPRTELAAPQSAYQRRLMGKVF